MTYTADPFVIARGLSGVKPSGAQCGGPPATKRHHWVYRVLAGGAEPLCAWECAHCLAQRRTWHEMFLTEEEARRMETASLDGHKGACGSARPETRPRRQAIAGPPPRRR